MADLNELQSSGMTKIIGSASDGAEQTPVKSTANGDLNVNDMLDNGGVQGAISVSTTAVAVRVGGSNLANRKALTAHNNGTATLYWGYTNAVTTATGTPLMRNQFAVWDAGPNTTIWIIAASGTHDVRVTEAA